MAKTYESNIKNISPIELDQLSSMTTKSAQELIKNFLIDMLKPEDFIKKDSIETGEIRATDDHLYINLKNKGMWIKGKGASVDRFIGSKYIEATIDKFEIKGVEPAENMVAYIGDGKTVTFTINNFSDTKIKGVPTITSKDFVSYSKVCHGSKPVSGSIPIETLLDIKNKIHFTDTTQFANLRIIHHWIANDDGTTTLGSVIIIDHEYSSFGEKSFEKKKKIDEETLYNTELNDKLNKLAEQNYTFTLEELHLTNVDVFEFDRDNELIKTKFTPVNFHSNSVTFNDHEVFIAGNNENQ